MQQALIDSLTTLNKYLPDAWLIPCDRHKKPAGGHLDANERYITPSDLRKSLQKGSLILPCWYDWKTRDRKIDKDVFELIAGYKLLTGKRFTYQGGQVVMVAVDVDGDSASDRLKRLQGGAAFPKTVSWTSGRPGRRTHLFWIGADKLAQLKNKINDDGLEFIAGWPGVVLPPSAHPTEGNYQFLPGLSFAETQVAELPDYLFEWARVKPAVKKLEDIAVPTQTQVPLYNCLDEETRRLIDSGVPEGSGHNDYALRVAAACLGTENHLLAIGQPYSDDAETLYRQFLQASGVPDNGKAMARFEISLRKRNQFDCVTEAVNNCIRGWEWTHVLKNKPIQSSLAIVSSSLWDDLKSLYQNNDGHRSVEEGKAKLAVVHKVKPQDIERLYDKVALECEGEIEGEIVQQDFVEFLSAKKSVLEVDDILPPNLAAEIRVAAKNKYHPSRAFAYLWPAIAAMVGAKIRVAANTSSGWYSDLVFYTADIGGKGEGKSSAGQDILGPILIRQAAADAMYERAEATLKTLIARWEEMTPQEQREHAENPEINPRLYEQNLGVPYKVKFDSPTIPGLIKYLGVQPHWRSGILFNDELAGLFAGFNQFNSRGAGNDRQFWLEFFNGRSFKTLERVTETPGTARRLKGQLMQVCGGMQPSAYRQYLALSKNQDGLTDRFLLNHPPVIAPPKHLPKEGFSIPPTLERLYSKLEAIPAPEEGDESSRITVDWEPEAYHVWEQCYVTLRGVGYDYRLKNEDFSGYCSKLVTYFPRLACVLNLLWQGAAEGDDPVEPQPIPKHIAEKTWVLIKHYAAQYLAMQSIGDESNGSSHIEKVWEIAREEGSITPRMVCHRLGGRRIDGKRIDSKSAAELLRQMAAAGFGRLEKTRGSIKLIYEDKKLDSKDPLALRSVTKPIEQGCDALWITKNITGKVEYVDYKLQMTCLVVGDDVYDVPFEQLQAL